MTDSATQHILEALTGERDLPGKIDVLGNAFSRRVPELTDWERKFVANLLDRWAKYEDKTKISPKQMAVIERIHDKIKHNLVL